MIRDYIAIAAQYQADILSGQIPACKYVKQACERNRRDLDRQESDGFPFLFDPASGRRICQMAEMLPHIKGPEARVIGHDDQGRPMWNPITLEPWQCWIFTTLFGWLHAETGRRRFRVSLILVPRKNGKSIMGAIVALYMLTMDGEGGPECYSVAKTRDQAKAVAEAAWQMAKRSPQFCEYFGIRIGSETTMSLAVPARAGKFAPLASDANSLDGLNVHLAVIDELHAHPTGGVWNVMDTGTGAREQSMLFAITTAGVDIGGICHQKLAYLLKILDGAVADESFFGINYTIDADDDIRTEVVQRKANPNYGVSVKADDLARKIVEAYHSSGSMNTILTKHFNVWIRTESGWMGAALWLTCAVAGLSIEKLKAYPCWIGVDLGETRDPSAVSLVFKLTAETYAVITFIYWPEDGIAKSPVAQVSGWARDGHIVVTVGNEADYSRIRTDLIAFFDTLNVQEIDFDRKSARLMMQDIRAALEPKLGRDRVQQVVLDIPQSVETMDPAMKTTEGLVLGKRLQHDGNPVMAWMVSNVVVERNFKGEIYPRKAGGKDSANKIDGPVSMWTALSRAMIGIVALPQPRAFVL